ncbi:hypothetical protein CVT26_006264 [Gymnopilus dilepis]|uniref:Copper transport protein n=1 Tax=Gymnopilus dilepis TaxID=231916 RepID=A0A409Y196_9AGAR|nr:hypothetical protein CVT26_006264 [Gymnopilus dilepis]
MDMPMPTDSMGSMSGSDSSSSSSVMMMMVPYLHFTGGDFLFFKEWKPTSAGALAAASIGLALLSIFERWLFSFRRTLDGRWQDRTLASTTAHANKIKGCDTGGAAKEISFNSSIRTAMPFIPSRDIPRAALYTFQMLVMYLLMLAIMTFQGAFFISIVVGLGIGEVIFGRVGPITEGH